MTTIATNPQPHTPLVAGLAVGAALVVGGVLGFAIDQSNSQPTQSEAPASAVHSGMWGFGRYDYFHGMNAPFYNPSNPSNPSNGTAQQTAQPFGRQMGL